MTMQAVSLASIAPVKGNPRKSFDAEAIGGLTASIKTDGLLQNVVVRPDGNGFAIVNGERRYRALKLLETRGELTGDDEVNVEVRCAHQGPDASDFDGREPATRQPHAA